jgi:hypothetical protein
VCFSCNTLATRRCARPGQRPGAWFSRSAEDGACCWYRAGSCEPPSRHPLLYRCLQSLLAATKAHHRDERGSRKLAILPTAICVRQRYPKLNPAPQVGKQHRMVLHVKSCQEAENRCHSQGRQRQPLPAGNRRLVTADMPPWQATGTGPLRDRRDSTGAITPSIWNALRM